MSFDLRECSACAGPISATAAFCGRCGAASDSVATETTARVFVDAVAPAAAPVGTPSPSLRVSPSAPTESIRVAPTPSPVPPPPPPPASPADAEPTGALIDDLDTSIRLAAGERVLHRAQLTPSMLLNHLKVTVVLTDRRVVVQRPHTVFGVIPHGYSERSTPLEAVSEVMAANLFHTNRALLGVGAALFGLFAMITVGGFAALFGLAALAFAAYLIASSRQTGLFIRNHGAGVLGAPAQGAERTAVEALRTHVSLAVLARSARC